MVVSQRVRDGEGERWSGFGAAYNDDDEVEIPTPAQIIRQITNHDRPNGRPEKHRQRIHGHDTAALLLPEAISDTPGPDRERTRARQASQEAEDDEHGEVRGLGTTDVPEDEEGRVDVVDGQAAVELAERREHEGPEGIAQEVDGDDEGGEVVVGGVELCHDQRDACGEHGGAEGSVESSKLAIQHLDDDTGGRSWGFAHVKSVNEASMIM